MIVNEGSNINLYFFGGFSCWGCWGLPIKGYDCLGLSSFPVLERGTFVGGSESRKGRQWPVTTKSVYCLSNKSANSVINQPRALQQFPSGWMNLTFCTPKILSRYCVETSVIYAHALRISRGINSLGFRWWCIERGVQFIWHIGSSTCQFGVTHKSWLGHEQFVLRGFLTPIQIK